jgi:membrane associated rhomboid family serine protease
VGLVLHRRSISLGPNVRTLVALAGLFIIVNLMGLILPILAAIAYAAHLGGFVTGSPMATSLKVAGRL